MRKDDMPIQRSDRNTYPYMYAEIMVNKSEISEISVFGNIYMSKHTISTPDLDKYYLENKQNMIMKIIEIEDKKLYIDMFYGKEVLIINKGKFDIDIKSNLLNALYIRLLRDVDESDLNITNNLSIPIRYTR